MTRPEQLLLPLTALLLAVTRSSSSSFGISSHAQKLAPRCGSLWMPRGGSLDVNVDDDEDDEAFDVEEDEEDDDDEKEEYKEMEIEEPEEEREDQDPLASVISSEPVSVIFKTNLGSQLIDTSLELLVSRARNIESVKNTLSRMLPGRPPVEALRILWGNKELTNDQLVDELVDDDEDEDEPSSMTLILDMVPPVDQKFATEMKAVSEMSTSDLLDAYTANAAAMYHNARSLGSNPPELDGPLSLQLRHEAMRIREQLTTGWPDSAMQILEMEAPSRNEAEVVEERRGQRVRSGKGGATTNLRKSLQRNLNVNWPETFRNFLLFIFFGVFGGRNTTSRNLLLMGAPLTFLLQFRPVKIWLKQGFYAVAHPPGILLSLLPAPQQAILSFDEAKAREALFGEVLVVDDNEDEDKEQDFDEDDY